ncbi:MAG: hypothetical protein IT370_31910 [Deltaproteobacteria bacterium]|nr:hypothetical protein [Deltaproteobacteria bacterium]
MIAVRAAGQVPMVSDAARINDEGGLLVSSDPPDHSGALRKFRLAYRLSPDPLYLFNMIVELKALGQRVEAADRCDEYLASFASGDDRRAVAAARDALDEELARLDIAARGTAQAILIDGNLVGWTPRLVKRVEPGSHEIRVGEVLTAVTAVAGGTMRIEASVDHRNAAAVEQRHIPAASSLKRRRLPWYRDTWGWIITGVGGLALATSVGILVHAEVIESRTSGDFEDAAKERDLGWGVGIVGAAVVGIGVVKLSW